MNRGKTLTLRQIERKSLAWGRAFGEWKTMSGLMMQNEWDRLPWAKKVELEGILEQGYDNITREKLGGPPA